MPITCYFPHQPFCIHHFNASNARASKSPCHSRGALAGPNISESKVLAPHHLLYHQPIYCFIYCFQLILCFLRTLFLSNTVLWSRLTELNLILALP